MQPDIPTRIHKSVKTRYLNDEKYRPQNLIEYLSQNDWPELLSRGCGKIVEKIDTNDIRCYDE